VSGTDHRKRLVAILAADAAGYSRLMASDEAATVAALDDARAVFRTLIQANQGRVIDMAGDSVLSVFELATAAVTAALAIQQELNSGPSDVPADRRMRFRIGVHLGEIIEKADGTVYGDGVNIAARLESLAEPGGITVSDSVRNAVLGKVAATFDDQGEQVVKNVAEPVRTYKISFELDQAGVTISNRERGLARRRWAITSMALLVLAVASVVLLWWPWSLGEPEHSIVAPSLPLPNRPSVVVLPFENLSNDSTQTYFADGLTDDLITKLSLYPELFVIARNSAFVYKGKAVDVKRVGHELGVAFVVEGSVRRENNRVRINAQLIDSKSGRHVWAERFDREFTDVFDIQDDITRSIAGRLAPEIARFRVNETRAKPTEDLDAWDLYLQATAAQAKFTREGLEKAIRLAETAIARDANFAAPHIVIARAKGVQFFYRWTAKPEKTLAEAIESARAATRLNGNDATGFAALGYLHRYTRDETIAVGNLERAIALNPNDANIRLEFAHTLDWFRHQKRALPQILEAIRLSPRDPRLQVMFFIKAHILFHLGNYDASLDAAREMSGVLTSKTWRWNYHLMRAASLAELGRADEARAEIENARAVNPKLSLAFIRQMFNIANNHPDNRRAWLKSLAKAGMPE